MNDTNSGSIGIRQRAIDEAMGPQVKALYDAALVGAKAVRVPRGLPADAERTKENGDRMAALSMAVQSLNNHFMATSPDHAEASADVLEVIAQIIASHMANSGAAAEHVIPLILTCVPDFYARAMAARKAIEEQH